MNSSKRRALAPNLAVRLDNFQIPSNKRGFRGVFIFIKIITARNMNKNQRKMYNKKKGII